MKTIKSTDPKTDKVNGTSLTGYLNNEPSYNQLVGVLGEPTYIGESGDGKVNIEWVVEYKGEIFTIYDWKLWGSLKNIPNNSYKWHVGGKGGYFQDNPTTDEFIEELEAELAVKNLLK